MGFRFTWAMPWVQKLVWYRGLRESSPCHRLLMPVHVSFRRAALPPTSLCSSPPLNPQYIIINNTVNTNFILLDQFKFKKKFNVKIVYFFNFTSILNLTVEFIYLSRIWEWHRYEKEGTEYDKVLAYSKNIESNKNSIWLLNTCISGRL